ncbi:MAG: hypothetical protein GKR91_19075 [Pseudomonadales bacterium]|nr:hypothetical protein [Pseudomonadales bacterium]
MRLITLFFLISVNACSIAGAPPSDPVRVNDSGVAIDGFSPVSYFTEGKPELGDPAYATLHNGVSYWFTSTQQQSLFDADPERYIPAHGGWCTLMMGGSGRRTPGHPESYAIVNERLMLFWSGDTEDTKGMGIRNWKSQTNETIEGETEVVENADNNWAEFLSGERRAQIWLYKRSDNAGINESQREDARENYID